MDKLISLMSFERYNQLIKAHGNQVNDSLEHQLKKLFIESDLKLAVAESCTGGLVCNLLTDVPGASTYFLGGIISYTNDAKQNLLFVSTQTLEKYGAVSQETVIEMARGVRARFSNEVNVERIIGVSVSGIAGPGGGSPEKPVGLVWIGLSTQDKDHAWKFLWSGNRAENKMQSARAVMIILLQYVKSYLSK